MVIVIKRHSIIKLRSKLEYLEEFLSFCKLDPFLAKSVVVGRRLEIRWKSLVVFAFFVEMDEFFLEIMIPTENELVVDYNIIPHCYYKNVVCILHWTSSFSDVEEFFDQFIPVIFIEGTEISCYLKNLDVIIQAKYNNEGYYDVFFFLKKRSLLQVAKCMLI